MTRITKATRLCGCGSCGDAYDAALRLYRQMRAAEECAIWNGAVSRIVVAMHHLGVIMDAMNTQLDEHELSLGPDVINRAIRLADDLYRSNNTVSVGLMEHVLDVDVDMVAEFMQAGGFTFKALTPAAYMQAVAVAIDEAKKHAAAKKASQGDGLAAALQSVLGDGVRVVNVDLSDLDIAPDAPKTH